MSAPIQEIMDIVILITLGSISISCISFWWPLALIPVNFLGYWFIFVPRISDGFFGFSICQSRWEEWNGITYWERLTP